MSSFRSRAHVDAGRVARAVERHPLLGTLQERYGLNREQAHHLLSESVLDAMDLLGSAYVNRMTGVVNRMTQLRHAIHLVYERVLAGSGEHVDPQALRHAFEQLHAATKELADPVTWAEREGGAVEKLPVGADLHYPGARTGLADRPSHAPRHGDAITGSPGAVWEVKTKRTGDITLEMDLDGLYWKFPELKDGEILHFPDYGYRVWRDPISKAIVEELVVGPSMTGSRKLTRGEDVLFSAAEMGEAYRKGGTQRAHGAAAPGLGFDAGYGVAHAIERINQFIEGKGVEAWVRGLRDNAAPGVEYVWTTRTEKRAQRLARREYTISAIADGGVHELYSFAVSVPDGPPLRDAAIEFEITNIGDGAARYGDPVIKGKTERLRPPEPLSEALGRTDRGKPDRLDPVVARTGDRLNRVRSLLDEIYARAAGEPGDELSRTIDDLGDAIAAADRDLQTAVPDRARLARIDAAAAAVTQRGSRAKLAQLRALLDALTDRER
jgi:hypothetical protein